MANSAFRDAYDLAFQVSPIILTGGSYSFPFPIIALTGQLASLGQGIATSGFSLDSFYARFLPIPGGTVINNQIATYPFANQQVAANAIIESPKNISLRMIAPVRDTAGYLTKLAIFTALRNSLNNHNNAGGTYTVATPAYIYQNCVMTAMTDITSEQTSQKQIEWQIDFIQPLISTQDANAAFSAQMAKLSGGNVLTQSSPSGITGAYASNGVY
ncbi:hypothetical protein [Polynucleobacter sp. 39-46-10]|jgi:hypothetical protein|uniref:hypothetical protein n=1 Tax=Polynucleobacter sp. 39-46-10 TaxID=1970428 RepID=UPI000BC9739F|nr:hypothetical protein [Polynucleobacter sp. 39-46-10]OYY59030.1 MAG: hypothetical protein B7Y55_01080 [Polynucleobacter sp. 35-46-207]OZA75783.1 MAG: hypothetical protein B7X71_10605 [Polynucleobacter sp. 39-46-10]